VIKDIEITSMDQLIYQLNDFSNNYVFRGHANSKWNLESTLERLLSPNLTADRLISFEEHSMQLFKSKFNIYNSKEKEPDSTLSRLAMMQHYGVPTRLLDLSTSPYVALYFAIEERNGNTSDDLCIYAFDYNAINEIGINQLKATDNEFKYNQIEASHKSDHVFDKTISRFSHNMAWITEPGELNGRIDRQSGCFMICCNKGAKLQDILNSDIYADCNMFRCIIPKHFYQSIFALLRKMNINGKTLYGDLQGLGRSIKMELSVYST